MILFILTVFRVYCACTAEGNVTKLGLIPGPGRNTWKDLWVSFRKGIIVDSNAYLNSSELFFMFLKF